MAGKRYYTTDDPEVGVTPSQLKRMGREKQRDYVRAWFGSNYEDPAEETPYNGQEGGYLYIWGGPYDAREELWAEFEGILSEERIEALADEIESDGITDWAPGPAHPDHARAAAEHAAKIDDQPEAEQPDGRSFLQLEDGGYLLTEDGDRLELEDSTQVAVPDLGRIMRDLERGMTPDYGSPTEQRERQALHDRVAALEAELARISPVHGGMGHNNPPLDEAETIPPALLVQVGTANAVIASEAAQSEPDALKVVQAATQLQTIAHWLAGKGDKAAEEFAKAFGKTLGAAAALALAGLLTATIAVVQAAATWLQTVTWPF